AGVNLRQATDRSGPSEPDGAPAEVTSMKWFAILPGGIDVAAVGGHSRARDHPGAGEVVIGRLSLSTQLHQQGQAKHNKGAPERGMHENNHIRTRTVRQSISGD